MISRNYGKKIKCSITFETKICLKVLVVGVIIATAV